MPALQIRDVPEDVRDRLAARARERGQSLQAYLLALVVEEARRQRNVEIMSRFDGRRDGTYFSPGEVAADVESVRAERETICMPTQASSEVDPTVGSRAALRSETSDLLDALERSVAAARKATRMTEVATPVARVVAEFEEKLSELRDRESA